MSVGDETPFKLKFINWEQPHVMLIFALFFSPHGHRSYELLPSLDICCYLSYVIDISHLNLLL